MPGEMSDLLPVNTALNFDHSKHVHVPGRQRRQWEESTKAFSHVKAEWHQTQVSCHKASNDMLLWGWRSTGTAD